MERRNPWYTLGHELGDHKRYTISEALELVNANDFVYPADLATYESRKEIVHDGVEGWFVPKTDWEDVDVALGVKSSIHGTMSTSGPNYEIMQRREIVEIAYSIAGYSTGDALVKAIGNMGSRAQQFFAYLELPKLVIDPNGIADEITRGMYVATSFDGSLSTTIGESDLRPSCTNMIHMALRRSLSRPIRVHHRRNAEERIRVAAQALEYAGAVEQAKIEAAEKMLKMDGRKAVEAVKDGLWPVSDPDIPNSTRAKRETARNAVERRYIGENNTTTDLVGENGWAAYQAVVEYIDWDRLVRVGKDGNAGIRRAENSVLPGRNHNDKVKASDIILALGA